MNLGKPVNIIWWHLHYMIPINTNRAEVILGTINHYVTAGLIRYKILLAMPMIKIDKYEKVD